MSVVEEVLSSFGPDIAEATERFVKVKAGRLRELMAVLRDRGFDFLMSLSAVDYPKDNIIQVVYHLFDYEHRTTLVVKVDADRSAPLVPSIEALWGNGQWLEREAYDLMGVGFEGNTDLRRLLMPLDWSGHPLRKDYEEPEVYAGTETARANPLDGGGNGHETG